MVSSDLYLLVFLMPFVCLLPSMWDVPNDELLMSKTQQDDECSFLMEAVTALLALLTYLNLLTC